MQLILMTENRCCVVVFASQVFSECLVQSEWVCSLGLSDGSLSGASSWEASWEEFRVLQLSWCLVVIETFIDIFSIGSWAGDVVTFLADAFRCVCASGVYFLQLLDNSAHCCKYSLEFPGSSKSICGIWSILDQKKHGVYSFEPLRGTEAGGRIDPVRQWWQRGASLVWTVGTSPYCRAGRLRGGTLWI